MQEDDEILDEVLNEDKPKLQSSRFPYFKYTFSYVFLMIGVSFYLSKYQQTINFKKINDALTGFSLISISVVVACIKEGVSLIYSSTLPDHRRPKSSHPMWFRVLETTFYFWCAFVLLSIAYIFIN